LYAIIETMSCVSEPRYEVLPFRRSEEQAAAIAAPIRLTVTTSPGEGVDRSLEHAVRLRALGHRVTLHLAARMVRGPSHLERPLARAADAGIDDLFVVGGDTLEPLGPYASAGALLDVLADHGPQPAAIGVAAYPEGHPLLDDAALEATLRRKAAVATYLVTQLCFDPTVLLAWIDELRAGGIELPLYAGAPGLVDRRRLLEISVRIGVGTSLRFLRKQHAARSLLGGSGDAAARFHGEISPHIGEPRRGIVGFHFFTFNELLPTWGWQQELSRREHAPSAACREA
jgi:methylenetetrahydrofolate reductase (NADPH)